jgi:hypothetical protein
VQQAQRHAVGGGAAGGEVVIRGTWFAGAARTTGTTFAALQEMAA